MTAEIADRREVSGLTAEELFRDYLAVKPSQKFNLVAPARLLGVTMLEDIPGDWSETYAAKRRKEGVASGTIRRELGAVNAAFERAIKFKKVKAEIKPVIDLPAGGQARSMFLDAKEIDQLWDLALAQAEGQARLPRITRFVCLAIATAARKNAIETLRWDQVDLDAELIDFRDTTRTASKKRRAHIPISSRLLNVLKRAKQEATTAYVLDGPGNIRKAWETFVAGTPWKDSLNIHDLRRSWATNAARRGVSLWDIANVLGDTLETVTKHYAVHQPDHLRGVIE